MIKRLKTQLRIAKGDLDFEKAMEADENLKKAYNHNAFASVCFQANKL